LVCRESHSIYLKQLPGGFQYFVGRSIPIDGNIAEAETSNGCLLESQFHIDDLTVG
jgi:hypothetical protein